MIIPDANGIKGMMESNKLFGEIEELDNEFYALLKEKDIEPKSINDIERVEKFFNQYFKQFLDLIKKSSFSDMEKKILTSRITIDFHGMFAEKYNLSIEMVVHTLGKWNVEKMNEAVKDLKTYLV